MNRFTSYCVYSLLVLNRSCSHYLIFRSAKPSIPVHDFPVKLVSSVFYSQGGTAIRFCHTSAPTQSEEVRHQSLVGPLCEEDRLDEAFPVFASSPNLFDASTLIFHYNLKGTGFYMKYGLKVYQSLVKSLILPTADLISSLMLLCNKTNPHETFTLYFEMKKYNIKLNEKCFSNLAFAVQKTKNLDLAIKLFEDLKDFDFLPTPSSCFALANVFANFGSGEHAVSLMELMVKNKIPLNKHFFVEFIKSCSGSSECNYENLKKVHKELAGTQNESETLVLSHLMQMYKHHGNLDKSIEIFNKVKEPPKMLCDIIINLCKDEKPTQSLELFDKLNQSNMMPSEIALTGVIVAVSNIGPNALEKGKQIHQQITQRKLDSNIILINSLIQMYDRCGESNKSIKTYDQMIENNITPTQGTFANILSAISNFGPRVLEKGKQIHQHVIKHKLDSNVRLITSLIQMYNKCGEPYKSIELYDRMIENNITPNEFTFANILSAISNLGPNAIKRGEEIHKRITQHKLHTNIRLINSLIQMYDKCGEPHKSVELYDKMISNNITPDEITFINILSAISNLGPSAIKLGESIHQQIKQHKFDTDIRLLNSLIQMYNKCGEPYKSVELYIDMIENNITPDQITFINILSAISNLGPDALEKGKQIHEQITQHKFDTNIKTTNSLIQMYDKCGEPNKSIKVYDQIIENNITPNEFTFINILTAISNIGPSALKKGKQIHKHITQHKLDTNVILISSLTQMYNKCGEPTL